MSQKTTHPSKCIMRTYQRRTALRRVVLWGLLAIFLASQMPTASAHNGNAGTIKVHDDDSYDTDNSNNPHVICQFWIEGVNMDGTGGSIVFYDWPPTGNKDFVGDDPWTGVPEVVGNGYHFQNGPYVLPPGHYRVEAYSDEGHPGNHGHFAKSKMFWVDPCDDVRPPPCPSDLEATETQAGGIQLNFTPAPGSDGTNIYRSVNGAPFLYLDTLGSGATQYNDTNVNPLTGYAYYITGLFGDLESQDCPIVELKTIPVFPSVFAGILAAAVGAVAYGGMRRKM